MSYREILKLCVIEAGEHGELVPPKNLLRCLEELDKSGKCMFPLESDVENKLYPIIKEKFYFITIFQENENTILSDEERTKFIALIRWLIRSIEKNEDKKPTDKEIVVYLFTAAFISAWLKYERDLWQWLSISLNKANGFLQGLTEIIKKTPVESLFLAPRYISYIRSFPLISRIASRPWFSKACWISGMTYSVIQNGKAIFNDSCPFIRLTCG